MTPWTGKTDPLARAITAAYARLESVSETGASYTQLSEPVKALMFSGLDFDVERIHEYSGALAVAHVQEIQQRGADVYRRHDDLTREEKREEVKRIAVNLIAGVVQISLLAGALHATQAAPSAPGRLQSGRVPTIAERYELSRDSVQWVLDLEIDRLERTAVGLHSLGLGRAAELLSDAASALRYELEGGADAQDDATAEKLVKLAQAQHAERAQLDRMQAEEWASALKDQPQ